MRVRRIGIFWVKLAAFLCLLAMMCNEVGLLLNGGIDNTQNATALKRLPRDSVDVLWIGSSHIFCGIVPQMLYDEYGITSAMHSMSNMSIPQMRWALKEALRRQSPDVIVMDVYTALAPYCLNLAVNEMWLRWEADSGLGDRPNVFRPNTSIYNVAGQMAAWLPLGSPYKPFAMWEAKRKYNIRLADMFEITKLHSRYSELGQENFLFTRAQDKRMLDFGTTFRYTTLNPDTVEREDYTLARAGQMSGIRFWQFTEEQLAEATLRPDMRAEIEQIIRLTRERGIELVFCVVPYMMNAAEEKLCREIERIAQSEGVGFVGPEAVQTEDFQLADAGHLNAQTALRYTAFWGEELSQRFDLPDRRQSADCRYAAWREHTGRAQAQVAAQGEYDTMREHLEMLTELDEDFLILLGFQGPVYDRFTEDDYWLLVEELGIPEETLAQWYDTGEGTLNVLVHNKQALASSYSRSEWEAELRRDAFGNAVSINGGRHRVNRKQTLSSDEDGLHMTVFSLSAGDKVKQISFDLTQAGE